MIRFCMHLAGLKMLISKVQDFRNFELSPMIEIMSPFSAMHRDYVNITRQK